MPKSPPERGKAERDRTAALALVAELQRALQQQERAKSVELIDKLVSLRAPMGQQWIQLSQIAAGNGEVGLARKVIGRYVADATDDPAARYKEVALLAYVGHWDEAYALLATLPENLPDPATYAYSRGTAALYLGKGEEARNFLERAIRANPHAGSPWLSLAVLVNFANEPELAERLIASERQMAITTTSERGVYYYALGKALADRGDGARAFAAFSQGAKLMKSLVPYSRAMDRQAANEAVNGYDTKRIAEISREQTEPTSRAIFVMGLPRSGTTLVEQILTSHSEVSDGAEIYRLALLAREAGGPSWPAVRKYADQSGAPAAAKLWSHWLEERFPKPGRVVAKTLNNSLYLGVAASLLPDAPLVWLTRDPLDCAWSCFRTRFSGEAPWSCDLEDIAFHFRIESDLLARWRDILGERLLVVPYEDLVTEPEPWIRKLLAHCGLAEEPQVFAPHENARTVMTSSVMQVRKPINRDGIGVSAPYREFLAPFIEAYYA